MIEIKVEGDWPETAIQDIIQARSKLMEFNLDSPQIFLIGPHHLLNNLDAQYKETESTYMSVIKNSGWINKDERFLSDDKFAILYAYSMNLKDFPEINFETAQIKLTNIRSVLNKNKQEIICPECGKKHRIPLGNRDGTRYLWCKCECGHEIDIQSLKGSAGNG